MDLHTCHKCRKQRTEDIPRCPWCNGWGALADELHEARSRALSLRQELIEMTRQKNYWEEQMNKEIMISARRLGMLCAPWYKRLFFKKSDIFKPLEIEIKSRDSDSP